MRLIVLDANHSFDANQNSGCESQIFIHSLDVIVHGGESQAGCKSQFGCESQSMDANLRLDANHSMYANNMQFGC